MTYFNVSSRPAPTVPVSLFVAVAAVVILIDWATQSGSQSMTREGGAIEIMSMLGYVYALMIYLRVAQPVFWPVPVILLFMAGREFDADKAFTSEGILSTKILLRDTALWEKALAIGIWGLLVAALVALVRHRGRRLMHDLRKGAPWALAFVAGLFIAAFSKTIDGLARKLAPFGIDVANSTSQRSGVLEETLELLIPVCFVIAICLKARAHQPD